MAQWDHGGKTMFITDNVCLLESTWGSNCYVIQAKETIMIDTGQRIRGKAICRYIESLNTQLKHILLTHYDVDIIGNAAMLQNLTGARVWASEYDIPYIQGNKDRPGIKKYLKYLVRVQNPMDIKPLPACIEGIKVIPTPGHTPGHVCFMYKDLLFVGDLLRNSEGVLRPPGWNWNNEMMQQSLAKIVDYPFKWVCPAHGRPINFSPPQQSEINLFRTRRRGFKY